MASLTAHLLEPSDHGRFGFHPDCPVCRKERLFGSLSSEGVIPRRARAALATGVLALSAAAPATAIGQEADSQQEGVVAPEPPTPEENGPGVNPGSDTTLPVEVPPAPDPVPDDQVPQPEESAPLESEPVEDPDTPIAPPGPETQAPADEGDPGVPPAEAGPSPVTAPPHETVESPPEAGRTPVAETPDAPNSSNPKPRYEQTPQEAQRQKADAKETGPPQLGAPPAVVPTTPVADAEGTATDQASPAAQDAPPPLSNGARVYVVQSGDSLWSIAKRLVGAGASPAKIAREVAHLWALNEDRIATGSPDLLVIGTELRLR